MVLAIKSLSVLINDGVEEVDSRIINTRLDDILLHQNEAYKELHEFQETRHFEDLIEYKSSILSMRIALRKLSESINKDDIKLPGIENLQEVLNHHIENLENQSKIQNDSSAVSPGFILNNAAQVDELGSLLMKIKSLQNKELNSKNVNTYKSARVTEYILSVGGILSILLIIFAVYLINKDIAKRNRLEKDLFSEKEKFSKVFFYSPISVVIISPDDYKFIEVNDTFLRKTGYTREEVLGESIVDLGILNSNGLQKIIDNLNNEVKISNLELNYNGKRKKQSTALISVDYVNIDGNKNILAIASDITEKKEIERARNESEEKYRLLAQNSRELVCLHDSDAKYLYISQSAKQIIGYTPDELLGKNPFDYFHPDDINRIDNHFKNLSAQRNLPLPIVFRFRNRNGNYIWLETLTQTICDAEGKILNIQTSSRDVTLRVITQQKLTESEEQNRKLIEVLEEGILFQDENNIIRVANSSACRILGLSEDQLLGKSAYDEDWKIIHEDGTLFKNEEQPSIITLSTGIPSSQIIMGIYKSDKTLSWLSLNAHPIFAEGKTKPAGVVVSFSDVTKRKKIEDELNNYIGELKRNKELLEKNSREILETNKKLKKSEQQLLRLNADKDKFFSIISHDLRSPFDALIGLSSIILDDYDELSDEEIKRYAGNINDASKHLLEFVDKLLQWSRIQSGRIEYNPSFFDVSDKISRIKDLLKMNAAGKNILLDYNNSSTLKVYADPDMIRTALQNLVSNAIKFTPKGGKIILSSEEEDGFVKLSVKDNGVGMNEEKVGNLFKIEKNISTPGTIGEKGTGLGLILCKELIEKNGGAIYVESSPGVGTTFSFTIPKDKYKFS